MTRPALRRSLFVYALAQFVTIGFLPIASAQPETTRIVFLAGPKDHGFPGRHEYEKDLRVLAEALESSTNSMASKPRSMSASSGSPSAMEYRHTRMEPAGILTN